MKYATKILLASLDVIVIYAWKKSFLDVTPVGSLDEITLANEKGVNKLLIAA